jgi:RNA polymerase sigma-70 factor (ECF subfamily)
MARACTFLLGMLFLAMMAGTASAQGTTLKYGDGQADGKQSLGGSGEMIEFSLPSGTTKIAGLRIHGSRYGLPEAPDESFLIFFLDADAKHIVHTQMAPYSAFERGAERWVTISFDRPITLPNTFWVVLDFRATARKGVYVSYDTSTGGKHSRIGLPGIPVTQPRFRGDWMVEPVTAK